MAALITRLRRLIGDASGASEVWTDDELQDALDQNSTEIRYQRLQELPTILAGGGVQFLGFQAEVGNWEDGAELVSAAWNILTPDTSDLLIGRWTFVTQPTWPIRVTGFTYDLPGAAVDVLENWMAREKLSFDAAADGHDFKRSQKFKMLEELADKYRGMAKAETGCIVSGDFNAIRR